MTLNFKDLNVASLDYTDIVTSLKTFLKQEPSLKDLDFDNDASAISLLCNILATGAAYNGVYAQFGYHESFLSTANLLESIVGLAANNSVLLEVKKSASTTRSITVTSTDLAEYTPFNSVATNGANIYFYNIDGVCAGSSTSITLYSGSELVQYTNWDYTTQSMTLPLTVEPSSIRLYTVDTGGNETKWTKISKDGEADPSNQYYFTVSNTVNGYLVSTNLPESYSIPTSDTVYVKAIISNGSLGNNASINAPSNVTFLTTSLPNGGYDDLLPDVARAKVQFNASSLGRCVTLEDYNAAIISSGITDAVDASSITVQNDTNPSTVKIYVNGFTNPAKINQLMVYLGQRSVAGINLIYSQ
jgi:hypothetical protein